MYPPPVVARGEKLHTDPKAVTQRTAHRPARNSNESPMFCPRGILSRIAVESLTDNCFSHAGLMGSVYMYVHIRTYTCDVYVQFSEKNMCMCSFVYVQFGETFRMCMFSIFR